MSEPIDRTNDWVRIRVKNTARQRMRRFIPLGIYGLFLAVLLFSAVWLVHLGLNAKTQLTAVRQYVTALRADIAADNAAHVQLDEQELAAHAHDAHADTHDPIWRAVAAIPDLGSDLKVAGGLSDIADDLANRVLPPLSDSTLNLRPQNLRDAAGTIDLTKLQSARTAVDNALPVLAEAQQRLRGLNQRVHLGAVDQARTELAKQLGDVSTSLTTASQALNLLPPMLGADGHRKYLLVFQNLAEARGTGGLLGAYGVLDADNGTLTLPLSGSDGDLQNKATTPVKVDLGSDYASRWQADDPFLDWFRANLSPDWPSSAALFSAHYAQQEHTSLDGVIGIDPLTLSYLLGPDTVHLSNGDTVSGADVPTYTMSTLYNKYGEDSPIRKQLLVELAKAAFTQLQQAPGSRLLSAVEEAAAQGRLQVWSSHASEQAILAATPLGSALPSTPGSFAWLLVNNKGPKTDFFLDRSLTYLAGACPASGPGAMRTSTIEAKLTDEVPTGQNSVVGHDMFDKSAPYGRGHSEVAVYGPVGASIQSATLDGKALDLVEGTERGHPVWTVPDVYTLVGKPQDLVIHLLEPVSAASYSWRPQPLARPETVSANAPACGS